MKQLVKKFLYGKGNESSLSPASGTSKFTVIGNAIPKSGTYLLNSIFQHIGKGEWQNTKIHILDKHYFRFHDMKDTEMIVMPAFKMLTRIKTGQLYAAHLHWEDRLAKELENRGDIRHFFMYRDPRDIMVSYCNFVTYSKAFRHWERSRHEQDFMRSFFTNDDDRLSYVIPKIMERENWHGYKKWLEHPKTCVVKFEDLYQELDAANTDSTNCPTLIKIFEHLGVDLDKSQVSQFAKQVLGNSLTASKEKDKIGQYKKVFKSEHYNLISTPMFQEVLSMFGYQ